MTVTFATYLAAQTNLALVLAQEGKTIRVLRLVPTSWGGVKIALVSDPGAECRVAAWYEAVA